MLNIIVFWSSITSRYRSVLSQTPFIEISIKNNPIIQFAIPLISQKIILDVVHYHLYDLVYQFIHHIRILFGWNVVSSEDVSGRRSISSIYIIHDFYYSFTRNQDPLRIDGSQQLGDF